MIALTTGSTFFSKPCRSTSGVTRRKTYPRRQRGLLAFRDKMTFCAEYFTTSCSSMLIPNNSFAICDLNPPALRRVQQLTNVLQNVHRGRSKGIFPALAAHGERAYNWKSKEQRNFGPQDSGERTKSNTR